MTVSNSSFVGNIAENHGGAIAAWGQGAVEVSNCSFVGNEAVGTGDYRRAGSGGAVYASPGVHVTVRGRGGGEGRGGVGGWGVEVVACCHQQAGRQASPAVFFFRQWGFLITQHPGGRQAYFHSAAAATAAVTVVTKHRPLQSSSIEFGSK